MESTSPVGAQHHIVPISTYSKTLAMLLVLMALTVGASYIQINSIANNLIAMGIAVTKAFLVVSIFMGVKYGTSLTKLWAMVGFVWVTLIFGILLDYATRNQEQLPGFTQDAGSALRDGNLTKAPPNIGYSPD